MVLLDLPSQALVLLKYNGHLSIVIVLQLLHSFPQGPHLQAFACISNQRWVIAILRTSRQYGSGAGVILLNNIAWQ